MNPIPITGQLAIGVLALSIAVAFLLLWELYSAPNRDDLHGGKDGN